MKTLSLLLILAAFVCTLSATAVANPPGNANPGIIPIRSQPLGKGYGEWAATWWQWILEAPATTSPAFGTGKCEDGQSGNVWFLLGTFGTDPVTRTCEIPEGRSLFFPLLNYSYFAFPTDPPDQRTLKYVRSKSICSGAPNTVSIDAKIDGVPVNNEKQYYEQSPFFEVQLATDNVFGLQGDENARLLSPAADSGYYLFLRPLAPGNHTVEWIATWNCGTQNIRYDIIVTPRNILSP